MVAVVLVAVSCSPDQGSAVEIVSMPPGVRLQVERLVAAEAPAAFAFGLGLLYVGQLKSGRILLEGRPVWDLAVSSGVDSGLMSLAVARRPEHPYLFAYYSEAARNRDGTEAAASRVARLTIQPDGTLSDMKVLLDVPGTGVHNGSVGVGPDDKLYVSIGDNRLRGEAQQPESPFGKMVRMTVDGTEAETVAMGLRDASAFGWDRAGRFLAADNGEEGGDRIVAVAEGHNYGWPPDVAQAPGQPGETLLEFDRPVAPAGIVAVPPGMGPWSDGRKVVVCGSLTGRLDVYDLDHPTEAPVTLARGCLYHVAWHPHGGIAFSNESGVWWLRPV